MVQVSIGNLTPNPAFGAVVNVHDGEFPLTRDSFSEPLPGHGVSIEALTGEKGVCVVFGAQMPNPNRGLVRDVRPSIPPGAYPAESYRFTTNFPVGPEDVPGVDGFFHTDSSDTDVLGLAPLKDPDSKKVDWVFRRSDTLFTGSLFYLDLLRSESFQTKLDELLMSDPVFTELGRDIYIDPVAPLERRINTLFMTLRKPNFGGYELQREIGIGHEYLTIARTLGDAGRLLLGLQRLMRGHLEAIVHEDPSKTFFYSHNWNNPSDPKSPNDSVVFYLNSQGSPNSVLHAKAPSKFPEAWGSYLQRFDITRQR